MSKMGFSEKVEAFSQAFERKARTDGSEYVVLRDGSPSWMANAIRSAHMGSSPCDTVFAMCQRVVDHLTGYDGEDIYDALYELEADPYTHDLKQWLVNASDADAYVEEVMAGEGKQAYVWELLAEGQQRHLYAIGEHLIQAITEV
jgi:hypothetical protein